MHLDWPIVRTASAAIASFVLVVLIHTHALLAAELTPSLAIWFLLGVVYTQFFEFWCHRFPMHRRAKFRFLENLRRHHLVHHRVFHGQNFQIWGGPRLSHIPGRYWVFPTIFLFHYVVLVPLMPVGALVAFLLGALLHYLMFEMSHWLTHIEDNALDRVIRRIPLLSELRARQIEHHRSHHEYPELAFNFNPPYLGDRIFGLTARPIQAPVIPRPERRDPAPIVVAPSKAPRPRLLVRYGTVAAVGVALVGAIVLAHGWRSQHKGPTASERIV